MEKSKSMLIFDSGMRIVQKDGVAHDFSSFDDRDEAYERINTIWETQTGNGYQ